MITAFVRTIILYFLIVVGMRLMGKRQVGELEPSELVLTMMISDLAAVPMQDFGIPLLSGLLPILTLLALSLLLSQLSLRSLRLRALICGTPTVLIRGGKLQQDAMRKNRFTIDELMEEEGFQAVFIGSGAGLPKFMGIPGENANGVFSANEYLTRSNLMKAFRDDYDTPLMIGKKVVVVGGGNVAMDAARTALRLGAEVHIVYRRSEKELPARAEEVHHAKEEGIRFNLLTNPVEILTDENGWVNGIICRRMELGEPDESGRRRPVEKAGSDFRIDADTVIMALGTSPNPLISATTEGLSVNRWKCIIADEADGKTTKEGVYAGGDAVTGAATVILAMEAGRAGARGIDEYLSGK